MIEREDEFSRTVNVIRHLDLFLGLKIKPDWRRSGVVGRVFALVAA